MTHEMRSFALVHERLENKSHLFSIEPIVSFFGNRVQSLETEALSIATLFHGGATV